MNQTGESEGFSANYSGHGFSGMKFAVRSVTPAEFASWVAKAQGSKGALTRERYLELAKPSEREPAQHFAKVDDRLFDYVLGNCVQPGRMCSHDMAAIDRRGGLGLASIYNVVRSSEGDYLMGMCTLPEPTPLDDMLMPSNRSPLLGAGLALPHSRRDTPLLAGADQP
jgi:cytochrome o ubiquinol oxidase subunit 2